MTFASIAPRVVNRILLRRWFNLLHRTLWWAALVMFLSAFWHATLPLAVLLLWLPAAALQVWRTRPEPYEALARWDAAAGRSEAFAAAWWFERQHQPTTLQQRHLHAQTSVLETSVASLPSQLPLRPHRLLVLAPLIALIPLLWSLRRPATDPLLSDDVLSAITAETDRLATKELDKKTLAGLTEAEKQELAKIQQQMKSTATELQSKAGSASARDVLSALEKNARAAEELAKRLGDSGQEWAGAALIAELRSHTDTADLGDATANRSSTLTSTAANALARQLREPQQQAETLQRLTTAFTNAAAKAEPKDGERLVGKPVLGAANELRQQHADLAAQHLETLSLQMQELAKREAAQKQLENLAQQLRNAGGKQNAADKATGGLAQMQATGQSGNTPGSQTPQVQQTPSNAGQVPSQLMPPGLGQQQQMLSQNPANAQQGAGQPGQQTLGQARPAQLQKSDGKAPADPNRPRLLAPIPGKPGDQQPSSLLIMPGQPPPNANSGSAMIPLSGQNPGVGKAELNNTPTQQKNAANSSVVDAARGSEGASSTRRVEGQVKDEAATRSTTQEALQQLQREESALDDAALPPARREHIRRYFNELRKRFEP